MILVDTDVLVDVLRGHPAATEWLESLENEEIILSGFVAAELVQGCLNREDQRRVGRFISAYRILWPEPDACDRALALFSDQHLRHGIGIFDALIAQMAVDMDLPLHTFNTRHYSCISALRTHQPYVRRTRPS